MTKSQRALKLVAAEQPDYAKQLGAVAKELSAAKSALSFTQAALHKSQADLRKQANQSVSQRPRGYGPTALVKLDRNLNATPHASATDAKRPANRLVPPKIGRAERDFASALRAVAAHAAHLIRSYEAGNHELLSELTQLLKAYSEALTPWATTTVRRMLGEVDARDRDSWRALGNAVSAQLKNDIRSTPVGEVLRALMYEQVGLIKSIPVEAAERVHKLTIRGLEDSKRAAEIADDIERSGQVMRSRAVLIARTEVARTASVLTETRARAAGVTHYRWQTSKDSDVRPGHREMQGKVCAWNDPPAVNEGGRIMYHHPGRIWNCRCWPEPLLELEEPT
jgi:SPP1 gp7 family putative phage head morphogenesis protein